MHINERGGRGFRDCIPALLTSLGLRSALIYWFISYLIGFPSAWLAFKYFYELETSWGLFHQYWYMIREFLPTITRFFSSSVYDCCINAYKTFLVCFKKLWKLKEKKINFSLQSSRQVIEWNKNHLRDLIRQLS